MSAAVRTRPIEILLVENNPVDVRLIRETFKDARISNNVRVAIDGQAAMDILCRRGVYVDTPKPDLIILDLSLPKKDGREVLEDIKGDDELKAVRGQNRQISQALDKFPLPMTTEPATHFKA